MTKYVLNSGGLRNQPELARKFFAETVDGLGNKPKILVCLFARQREYWESKFQDDKDSAATTDPSGVTPDFQMAMPDTFEEQVEWSDIVVIHGGDDHLLLYWLKRFDLPRIWEGKVVAVSSAGSDVLAKHFWTCDWRGCMDGLGILPIKFLPHYQSDYGADDPRGPVDWQKGYDELQRYGDQSLPIHALREGEFVVFNK